MAGFARSGICALLFFGVLILISCSRTDETKDKELAKMRNLGEQRSGYSGGPQHWRAFLDCWQLGVAQLSPGGAPPEDSLVARHDSAASAESAGLLAARHQDIARLEQRIQLKLPKSYRDFLLSFQLQRTSVPRNPAEVVLGLWEPSRVGMLSELEPDVLHIFDGYPNESDDGSYYIYGIHQDDSARRTRYLKKAIVVGRYGDALYELLLLYPGSKTLDGEMEAAILHHSGEFRATSFAELMRQLSVREIRNVDGEGVPYPQTMLKGTCAEKLPIENIWWD